MCVTLVQVEDSPMFDRDGFDIHSDIHVSFTQAILGGEVRTTGLSGPIVVKVGPLWSLFALCGLILIIFGRCRFQLELHHIIG